MMVLSLKMGVIIADCVIIADGVIIPVGLTSIRRPTPLSISLALLLLAHASKASHQLCGICPAVECQSVSCL